MNFIRIVFEISMQSCRLADTHGFFIFAGYLTCGKSTNPQIKERNDYNNECKTTEYGTDFRV